MKVSYYIGLSVVLWLCAILNPAFAQQTKPLEFKSGNYTPEINITSFIAQPGYTSQELVNGNYYRIIQFENIPTVEQKTTLKNAGIELLQYMPQFAFYASIKTNASLQVLQTVKAISIIPVQPDFKLNAVLKSEKYPAWAVVNENTIELNAVYYSTISKEYILNKLISAGAEITMSNDAQMVRFRVAITQLPTIYNLPEFYYFEEKDKPGEPEGTEDRSNHRSNYLLSQHNSGLKFDGTSVTVMLQDNSLLDNHIDYTGRFFNDASAAQSGDHGEHCGGIIAGAGNRNPLAKGMAPGADVLVYNASDNNFNDVPALYATSNLTITSKSYSNGTNAGYTTLARQMDQQSRQMNSLIHVFSAGNEGPGFSTVTGGHKQAKNVIAVANLSYTDVVASSSSRGPALDGRIKPDISAVGTNVFSTVDPNGYQNLSGTSMACPGVAGVMAQLYHAYKVLNAGANPNAGLMKATIMNTADDYGNIGPDFIFGWGRINARRAFNVMSNNQYITSAITQGANNIHTINVPVGTTQVRIMVYWTDYEGAAAANPALVNDIDMLVSDGTFTYNPWMLNPTSPLTPATPGTDHLNNVEQVIINNPVAGNYSVNINGFVIPQGPQEYIIVYEFLQDEVVVTYPLGGEGLDPGTLETIRWDSYGGTGTFHVEYSTDNGSNWNTINANVASTQRHLDWFVPAVLTGEALIRVTRGVITDISDDVFSIIDPPAGLTIAWACPDSMKLTWNNMPGVNTYEVYMLGNKYMDSVGVADTNSFVFYNTNPTLSYWFSVRSLGPGNARSERAIAIQKAPGIINCPITIDNSITNINPANNAQYLSCQASTVDVTITLVNTGQTVLNNVPVHYTWNGGAAVDEIFAGPLNPASSASYTFTATVTPTLGINQLLVWSDLTGDGNLYNDTVETQFDYIFAPVQNLPWTDDFETFALCGTANNCGAEICPLGNGFMNETNGTVDDIDWRTDENGTPTNNTGPDVDYNPGDTLGNYLYLEASSGCNAQEAHLVSPCIDLAGANAPGLQFAYHMEGDDMGSLSADIFSGGVWTNVFSVSGDQGPNWLIEQISLTAFAGNIINVRLRGITGAGSQSDVAIDDVMIIDGLSVNDITQPLNFIIYPNPASNEIFISGFNLNTNTSIEIFNTIGELIWKKPGVKTDNRLSIDISPLPQGAYIIKLVTNNGTQVKKFVKQ